MTRLRARGPFEPGAVTCSRYGAHLRSAGADLESKRGAHPAPAPVEGPPAFDDEGAVAAGAHQAPQQVGNWKCQFLEAGKPGLAAGKSGPSTREQQLEAAVSELTQALGETAVELRV